MDKELMGHSVQQKHCCSQLLCFLFSQVITEPECKRSLSLHLKKHLGIAQWQHWGAVQDAAPSLPGNRGPFVSLTGTTECERSKQRRTPESLWDRIPIEQPPSCCLFCHQDTLLPCIREMKKWGAQGCQYGHRQWQACCFLLQHSKTMVSLLWGG